MNGLMTWLAAALVFAQPLPAPRNPLLISQPVLSTHFDVFLRKNLRKLPQVKKQTALTCVFSNTLKPSFWHIVCSFLM